MDIDWSAGSNGIRQNIYWSDDGLTLSIVLTSEKVIIDLIDSDGEIVGTESATYEEMADALRGENNEA